MMRGFTLLEMLIVISLLAFLGGFSAIAGSDSYQRALSVNDLERIVGALRQARSFAQSNTCRIPPCDEPTPEGVRLKPGGALMFEGSEFRESSVYESISLSESLLIDPGEVIFLPRSGETSTEETFHITDAAGRNRAITVSKSGAINIQSL
jgi:prepilin-type N-terminal cleavage/methylation domain-containing protein